MAILTVAKPTPSGVDPAFVTAAGGGDSFPNTGKEYVHVKNVAAGGTTTVTFDSPGTCDFNLAAAAAHDATGTVADGAEKVFGPFDPKKYNDANGRVQITYSEVTGVTVAVIAGN